MQKLIINNIKNIVNMEFVFPEKGLHILTGENGTGKSTLFTCISRIRNSNAFRTGFLSSKLDKFDQFSGTITFESKDGESTTYSRRSSGEWRAQNNKDVFGKFSYPEILHNTTNDSRLFIQSQEDMKKLDIRNASAWIIDGLNYILNEGKYSKLKAIPVGETRGRKGAARRNNTAYAIEFSSGEYFTEKNFSFGEIVLLNLLISIENVPRNSMILIDEVELALHPSAQIRLLERLRAFAKDKSLTIILSTHSSSIIRSQKSVILLENDGSIDFKSPPARAIGAIASRDDSTPDVIVLVEDEMAKYMVEAMRRTYIRVCNDGQAKYIDFRTMYIGPYSSVVNFYKEAKGYVFYDNINLYVLLDKDVETDIIKYPQFGNLQFIDKVNEINRSKQHIRYLPWTPEVLLTETIFNKKADFERRIHEITPVQTFRINLLSIRPDYSKYYSAPPIFTNKADYDEFIKERGAFRAECKKITNDILHHMMNSLNETEIESSKMLFDFVVNNLQDSNAFDVRPLMGPILNRS